MDRESLCQRQMTEQKLTLEREAARLKLELEAQNDRRSSLEADLNKAKSDFDMVYKESQMIKLDQKEKQSQFEDCKNAMLIEKEVMQTLLNKTQSSLRELDAQRNELQRSNMELARRKEATEEANRALERLCEDMSRNLQEEKKRSIEKEQNHNIHLLQWQRKASESEQDLKMISNRQDLLNEDVKYYQAREQELVNQLAALELKQREDKDKLLREKDTLTKNLTDVQVKSEWNESEIERVKDSANKLVCDLNKAMADLQRRAVDSEAKVASLKNVNQQLLQDNSALQLAVQRSKEEIDEIVESTARRETEMKNKITDLQDEIRKIRKKANDMIQDKVNQVDFQVKQIGELKNSLALAASYERKCRKLEEEMAALKMIESGLKKQNLTLSSEIACLIKEKSRLHSKSAALLRRLRDFLAEFPWIERLSNEIRAGQDAWARAEKALADELSSLRHRLTVSTSLCKELEAEILKERKECQEMTRENKHLKEESQRLKGEMEEMTLVVESVNEQIRSKEVQLGRSEREKQTLKEEYVNEVNRHAETKMFLEKALDDVEMLEEVVRDSEMQKHRTEMLFAKSEQSYKQLNSMLESELKVLSSRAENVFDMNNQHGEDFALLVKRFRDLEQTNESLKREKSRIEESYSSLFHTFHHSLSLSARETGDMLQQIDRDLDESAACMLEKLLEAENQLQALRSAHQYELEALNASWKQKLDKANVEIESMKDAIQKKHIDTADLSAASAAASAPVPPGGSDVSESKV